VRWIAVLNSFPTHLKVFFSFISKKSYSRNGGGGKGAAESSEQEIGHGRRQMRSYDTNTGRLGALGLQLSAACTRVTISEPINKAQSEIEARFT